VVCGTVVLLSGEVRQIAVIKSTDNQSGLNASCSGLVFNLPYLRRLDLSHLLSPTASSNIVNLRSPAEKGLVRWPLVIR
jgi:hypothetical protein